MRLKINFTANTTPVPVHTQQMMNSYVHKCLGRNNSYHDAKNNYAISTLQGGKLNKEEQTLEFENGSYFVISSLDNEFLNKLLIGIMNNQDLFCGMTFNGVDYLDEVFYDGWNHFATLSPFIIKHYFDKKNYSFVTLNDADFQIKVKEYLIKKISKVSPELNLDGFDVHIPNHESHKVKKIMVKNVVNKANQCQISIHCSKEVAKLIYNIGLGQSTGSGFGTLYKTESRKSYK
jgi:CRISPR-associated endoribonuclease Cas6